MTMNRNAWEEVIVAEIRDVRDAFIYHWTIDTGLLSRCDVYVLITNEFDARVCY